MRVVVSRVGRGSVRGRDEVDACRGLGLLRGTRCSTASSTARPGAGAERISSLGAFSGDFSRRAGSNFPKSKLVFLADSSSDPRKSGSAAPEARTRKAGSVDGPFCAASFGLLSRSVPPDGPEMHAASPEDPPRSRAHRRSENPPHERTRTHFALHSAFSTLARTPPDGVHCKVCCGAPEVSLVWSRSPRICLARPGSAVDSIVCSNCGI